MVTNMVDNENHPPEQDKPDKNLRLDLSEAMPHGFDEDDDEIIELKDEVNITPKKTETEIELFEEPDDADKASELPAVEKIIDLDALEDDDSDPENVIRLSKDLAFEEEDEDADDILSADKEPVLKADGHNEVVEITEFDDMLSEDANEMVTLSEISEELESEELEIEEVEEEDEEEEFLELLDVEEDDDAELEELEHEIIQFDDPGDDIEDVELKDFINDSLNEEIQIDEEFEEDLVSTLGVEAGEEMHLTKQEPTEEDFDFSMDSSEISKKIDQLDTIFFDDTQAEAELDENAEFDEEALEIPEPVFDDIEDEIEAEDVSVSGDENKAEQLHVSGDEFETEDAGVSGGESPDVPYAVGGIAALGASQDQMEQTIEQIIERKFSGKIETIITQIIEKAVSKEIKRLKKILLEDDADEDL